MSLNHLTIVVKFHLTKILRTALISKNIPPTKKIAIIFQYFFKAFLKNILLVDSEFVNWALTRLGSLIKWLLQDIQIEPMMSLKKKPINFIKLSQNVYIFLNKVTLEQFEILDELIRWLSLRNNFLSFLNKFSIDNMHIIF